MKKSEIQEFTRRITQSNGSNLVVITYEIFFAHMQDAKCAYENVEWEEFKQSIRQGQRAIQELMDALSYKHEMSSNLYRIYSYCKDLLAKAMYKQSADELEEAVVLMKKLYKSFKTVAEQDTSAPIMKNTQQVYAGYTYGKGDIVENCQELDKSRGFLV